MNNVALRLIVFTDSVRFIGNGEWMNCQRLHKFELAYVVQKTDLPINWWWIAMLSPHHIRLCSQQHFHHIQNDVLANQNDVVQFSTFPLSPHSCSPHHRFVFFAFVKRIQNFRVRKPVNERKKNTVFKSARTSRKSNNIDQRSADENTDIRNLNQLSVLNEFYTTKKNLSVHTSTEFLHRTYTFWREVESIVFFLSLLNCI